MDFIYMVAVILQVLVWSWAFWIDGDNGASREFMIMELLSFGLMGLGLLIDYIRGIRKERKRQEREAAKRRRQFREWKEEEWRRAE